MADDTQHKIAILTSGGDSPGMNAAIRAVVRCAIYRGGETFGVMRGYEGLIDNEIKPLALKDVGGIINRGGTILRSARSSRFKEKEFRLQAEKNLRDRGIDSLVVIGGDGSYRGARELHEDTGIQVIGLPGTIDNDIAGTDFTIGFDTAINTALEAIDRIRDTASSFDRIFVVEVMGRHAGFIALQTAVAGGAEAVLLPEVKFDLEEVCRILEKGRERGKVSGIVVVAEGAASSMEVAYRIKQMIGAECRVSVIGYLQRGGAPTAFDRVLASRMGEAAVEAIYAGETCKMVGEESDRMVLHPIEKAWQEKRPINEDLLRLLAKLAT